MIPKPEQARRSVGPVEITRRDFVKAGGALFISLAMLPRSSYPSPPEAQPTPTPIASCIEIRSDNTILVRTGRTEIGTGMSAFYAQVVAEELYVRPEAVTLLTGDTDKTPDGGSSAGFRTGAANLRKVAAYTHQALLELAAKKLGVLNSALTISDGVVSAGK